MWLFEEVLLIVFLFLKVEFFKVFVGDVRECIWGGVCIFFGLFFFVLFVREYDDGEVCLCCGVVDYIF